jgi:hypothetical protein
MIRTTLAAIVLAASASFAFAATDADLRDQIVGAWGQDASCGTGKLTFNADGTFALSRPDRNETGTWQIAGGMLTGIASDGTARPEVGVSFDGEAMNFAMGPRTDTFVRCAS